MRSRLQPMIARSTFEAEYMAAIAVCLEAMWLRKVLLNLEHPDSGPIVIKCDNKTTLTLLHNTDMQSSCIKHIDNRHQVSAGNKLKVGMLPMSSVLP